MYDICPLYDRLHQVYVSSVIKNPPPLKQSEPGPIPVPAASGDNFFASELDNDDDSGDASEDVDSRASRRSTRDGSVITTASTRSTKARSKTPEANTLQTLSDTLQEVKEICQSLDNRGNASSLPGYMESFMLRRIQELEQEKQELRREMRVLKDQLSASERAAIKLQLDHCNEKEEFLRRCLLVRFLFLNTYAFSPSLFLLASFLSSCSASTCRTSFSTKSSLSPSSAAGLSTS
ncbi:hypothetical protein BC939DRAFT_283889 [Gamsiella multidivaricata]|uniref:uncharacterized protein n=1 Tax=Gamsiella multidivaricata TaxID=101098 RepID=UPI00221F5B06|nr:uncharacterized protein BC939DRAFT_283889 [Gamsiella multidivaricata]KAI7830485.1 hypothetical protein BC939DRAFT_283889 [Gamsiella multidivaricata]